MKTCRSRSRKLIMNQSKTPTHLQDKETSERTIDVTEVLHEYLKMSGSLRTLQDSRDTFKSLKNLQSYNQWAETYNTDSSNMGYSGPLLTARAVRKHLKLSPDQARVLDVACGSGLVAQELYSLGFRQFVGVDGCQAMLEKAHLTELYQDLHLAVLGTQPLPVASGEFDVVTMTGALYRKFVPVEVIRELYQAAKPGGLVVMTRANYNTSIESSFTEELHRELGLMEEKELWELLELQQVDQYLLDYNQPDGWFSGSIHIYHKTL